MKRLDGNGRIAALLVGVVVTMAGIFRGQAADALAISQPAVPLSASHSATALMESLVTERPSSLRSRFSRRTFIE